MDSNNPLKIASNFSHFWEGHSVFHSLEGFIPNSAGMEAPYFFFGWAKKPIPHVV
jgi:hypothetical protein